MHRWLLAIGLGVAVTAVFPPGTAAQEQAEEAAAVEDAPAPRESGATPAEEAEAETPEPVAAPADAPREDTPAAAPQRPVAAFWFVVPGQ